MAKRDRGVSRPGGPVLARLALPALAVLAALLLAADLLVGRHGPFAVEHLFGFYAVAGFAGAALPILAALAMRRLLGRPEDDDRD